MLAARLNFIAQDNLAIQYPAKEICPNMARLETTHFAYMKKLACFLLGVKTVRWEHLWQDEQEAVKVLVFTDSDWAGCLRTRRWTSGGLATVNWHPFKHGRPHNQWWRLPSAEEERRAVWACSQCFVRWGPTQVWDCQQTLRRPRRLHLPESSDICAIWR